MELSLLTMKQEMQPIHEDDFRIQEIIQELKSAEQNVNIISPTSEAHPSSTTSKSTASSSRQSTGSISPPAIINTKAKQERRTAHNLIEKKYRNSLNNKLLELRTCVFGNSAKANKAAILRGAIDRIRKLEAENYQLKMENFRMKVTNATNQAIPPTEVKLDPSTLSQQPQLSPPALESGGRPEPQLKESASSYLFMVGFLLLNPILTVFDYFKRSRATFEAYRVAKGPSRTLLSVAAVAEPAKSMTSTTSFLSMVVSWVTNSMMLSMCLSRCYVSVAERVPRLKGNEETLMALQTYYRQAVEKLREGYVEGARERLESALQFMLRPLPQSPLHVLLGVAWQLLRYVSRCILVAVLGWERYQTLYVRARYGAEIQLKTKAQVALVYQALYRIHSAAHTKSMPSRLYMALKALNFAEVARQFLPLEMLMSIYRDVAQLVSAVPVVGYILKNYFEPEGLSDGNGEMKYL